MLPRVPTKTMMNERYSQRPAIIRRKFLEIWLNLTRKEKVHEDMFSG